MYAKKNSEQVHLDSLLQQLGSFGRYQLYVMALLVVPYVMEAVYSTHYVFSAAEVDYRCRIDECERGSGPAFRPGWVSAAGPANSSRRCQRHPRLTTGDAACSAHSFDTSRLLPCDSWLYEDPYSLVAEFQLACEGWKRTMIGTVRNVGCLTALMFAGQLSDRLGRKFMIYVAGTVTGLLGVAKTFATSYVTFIVLEYAEAMSTAGLYSALYTFTIELVHKDKRILYSCCLGILYALGGASYSFIAWLVPYWRHQLRVIYAPGILLCFYAFLMDDSVRWLLSKGKKANAIEIILKMAQSNSVNFTNKTLANLQCTESETELKKSPFRETFGSKVLLGRLAICCVWWLTCVFVYYGLTISSVSIGGDKYWSFALTYLVDIPGTLACTLFLDRFGRRRSLLVSFSIAGVLYVWMVFITPDMVWLSTTVFLLGKLTISFTFCAVYIYTSELFPTYTRNTMHATCSCVGRIGAIVAPQVPLLAEYWASLPPVLYAACSLAAALLTLLTPDTRHARLPDTALEAKHIGQLTTEVAVTKM